MMRIHKNRVNTKSGRVAVYDAPIRRFALFAGQHPAETAGQLYVCIHSAAEGIGRNLRISAARCRNQNANRTATSFNISAGIGIGSMISHRSARQSSQLGMLPC